MQGTQTRKPFTAEDVCRAARIKRSTLNTWRIREDRDDPSQGVVLHVKKKGKKEWTRYSEADALRVCLLAQLIRSGIDLALASRITSGLFDDLPKNVALDAPPYVVVSKISRNVDDPKKLLGFAFQVLWHKSRMRVIRSAETRSDDTDSVAYVIDLPKIFQQARAALRRQN
jgi:hypothetical protein